MTGLTNETPYYFRVVASNAGGNSAASTEVSATPVSPPSAPRGLRAKADSNTQVTVSWAAVSGATSYKVYYSGSAISNPPATGVPSVNTTTASAPVAELTSNSQYYFKVVASNAGGDSAASSEVNIPKLVSGFTVFRDAFTMINSGESPQMVVLPTGSFTLGTALASGGESDERPTRTVNISNQIAMGMYEVTFAEYDAFADAVSGRSRPTAQWGRGNQPVINVNQADAKAYAAWLSTQTGKTYRLPSEAEWEYAGRARTATLYSFGNTIACTDANYNRNPNQPLRLRCPGSQQTLAVGRFAANTFGLYDMHGNVDEWVEDCYINTYTSVPAAGATNAGASGGARTTGCTIIGGRRIVSRGGHWSSEPNFVRVAYRSYSPPSLRANFTGFRLVRVSP